MNKNMVKDGSPKKTDLSHAALQAVAAIAGQCQSGHLDESVCTTLLHTLGEIIPTDGATLFLADHHSGKFEAIAGIGEKVEVLDFLTISDGTGLSGWAAYSKKAVLLADRSHSRGFDPDRDYASFMSIPLLAGDQVLGVLNLGNKKPNSYTKVHVDILTTVGGVLVLAIEKLMAQKACQDNLHELKDLRDRLETAKRTYISPVGAAEISAIVGGVNHDINNGLAVILGNIQCLMIEKVALDQKSLTRFRRIEAASKKIETANQYLLRINDLTENLPHEGSHDKLNLEDMVTDNA